MTPDEDVEDVPLIRPCASRQVVFVPLMLEVPVTLPWASLKVVLEPDVLVVVVDLPFWSLRLAFLTRFSGWFRSIKKEQCKQSTFCIALPLL